MFTAPTPRARGLALATILLSLALAARAPAAHASTFDSGPVVCKVCPNLPQPPRLAPLQATTKGNAVLIHGQGFSSWGGVDLYLWQHTAPAADGTYTFAGTVHTIAHGSDLSFRLAPLVHYGSTKVPCLDYNTIDVVAIDDSTHFSTGVQALNVWCYALTLPSAAAYPSLKATLHATTGTIHLSGHHYTPHTQVAVYFLPNGLPAPVPGPTTLTAMGTQFATTLSTGHVGCSDTLSWTMFALDQTANAASSLHTVKDPCYIPPPPK